MNKVAFCLVLSAATLTGGTTPVTGPALPDLVYTDCGSCQDLAPNGGLGPDSPDEASVRYQPDAPSYAIPDSTPNNTSPPWQPLLTKAEVNWMVNYLLSGGTD